VERNEGITLIALIITIIILLILVGVSINLAIKGDLFGSAEKAVSGTNDKTAQEQTRVDELMGELGRVEEQQRQDNLPGTRVTENTKYVSNGKTAWIPKGFTVSGIKSEQSIDNGLVIYDIPEGITPDWSNPDSVKTKYNQFVWIPVEVTASDTETSIEAFKRSAWTANAETGGERTTGLNTSFTEPNATNDTDDKTGIAKQIANLTKSIYKHGGFYIGRYEAGSKTPRTSSSGVTEIGIKQDMYPYIYVKWGDSMSSIGTTGAVYLSNSLYNTNEYGATSMLCTGACWDSMLDFIKDREHSVMDSRTWGNYSNSETFEITRGAYAVYNSTLGSFNNVENKYSKIKDTSILLTTGATERNCSKNIYDVAGNCLEWTTESSSSSYRVSRGGSCNFNGFDYPAYNRVVYSAGSGYNVSFRSSLYVSL
jgi:hypothetical protein